MKHVVVEHHLRLLYGALKANNFVWDKFDLEIKTIKADSSTESNEKTLRDLRWTPKTGPQVKMDFRWSAGEEKADDESKTQTA